MNRDKFIAGEELKHQPCFCVGPEPGQRYCPCVARHIEEARQENKKLWRNQKPPLRGG